jgi:phenylalanyl-tRNA synthetase beta chain
MKLPMSWLRSWIDLPWSDAELAARLTMLGIEVEAMNSAAPPFSGVVVAEIISAAAHPQADKLRVCQVAVGQGQPLQIVCGAPNARAGLRSALATVGAQLPGGLAIGAARLRGVESQGMLCSAKELQLAAGGGEGILELPADAALGASLRDYLQLDEVQVELGITPNRGDAMSVLGVVRELAALSGAPIKVPPPIIAAGPATAAAAASDRFAVRLQPGAGCARFASRVLRGVDNRRPVPAWLRARLEHSGLRSISPVVDVTNFVLLELGQPMHAYDLGKLQGGIDVRKAGKGEALRLLDGRDISLDPEVMVIADDAGAVGMAGIMGGERSAISDTTRDLFLEVAWFDPQAVAGRARRYGLQTDASQRYERGVDPALQERALERATELIRAIAGGQCGPAQLQELPEELPRRTAISLRSARISRLLGAPVAPDSVTQRLGALGMTVETVASDHWRVTPPSWRFDISIEADLIEELARLGGYDAIVESAPHGARRLGTVSERRVDESQVLALLAARGFQEAITFGFTDPAWQQRVVGASPAIALRNPIASNLSVMRASLWPGLLNAALENQRRQRERVRLFEIATCFRRGSDGRIVETQQIAGLAQGARLPEQWGTARAGVDFHDLKSDVSALLALGGQGELHRYEADPSPPPGLHPGRSARIVHDGRVIGHLGELHPALARDADFTYAPILFELEADAVLRAQPARYHAISSFPQIRRDISFTVPSSETFGRIADRVSVAASTRLHELRVFDLYQGQGVESGRKSVALGLILQDLSRTLTDADADEVVARVCAELRSSLDARIRE